VLTLNLIIVARFVELLSLFQTAIDGERWEFLHHDTIFALSNPRGLPEHKVEDALIQRHIDNSMQFPPEDLQRSDEQQLTQTRKWMTFTEEQIGSVVVSPSSPQTETDKKEEEIRVPSQRDLDQESLVQHADVTPLCHFWCNAFADYFPWSAQGCFQFDGTQRVIIE
jgi:hypothetical protein